MIQIRSDEFYRKMDKLSNKIEAYGNAYHQKLTQAVDVISKWIYIFGNFILSLLTIISDLLMTQYKKARYLTIPLHWIWIFLWAYLSISEFENEPTNKVGVHYIQALAGDGKSTFLWQKMADYAKMTGKCSYVTTKMEKIKYDELGTPYLNHIHFDIHKFFGLRNKDDKFGQQLIRFNPELACAVVFDEIHVLNNNRNNRSSEYNHTFIPMISSFVLQRHFGINWILVASQQPRNDNQIMNILTSYNKVKIKKGFIYSKWLEDGKFTRRIKGWRVKTFTVSADNEYLKLDSRNRWFKPATVSFDDFETLNMKDTLDNVPIDRKDVLR
jgi:hypothetical protein